MRCFSAFQRIKLGHFWAMVITVGAVSVWSQPGFAQDADAIQQILEDVLGAPAGEVLGAGGALDNARGRAAQGKLISPLAGALPDDLDRVISGLSPQEVLIAQRFCEGRLAGSQRETLALIPAFSLLEQDFCSRAGELLLQFGYDIFDGPRQPAVLVNGAIPETYRLGIGD